MLLLLKQSLVLKKNTDKKNLVEIPSFRYGKIVFILLNKIVAVYIKLIFIHIQYFKLKKFFLGLVKYSKNNSVKL